MHRKFLKDAQETVNCHHTWESRGEVGGGRVRTDFYTYFPVLVDFFFFFAFFFKGRFLLFKSFQFDGTLLKHSLKISIKKCFRWQVLYRKQDRSLNEMKKRGKWGSFLMPTRTIWADPSSLPCWKYQLQQWKQNILGLYKCW